jgi:membrane carboxypeptidase/penicillin-binding protein PbpC
MDSAYLPALAALAGSATGGLTSLASAWLTLRRQGRTTRLSRDRAKRQKLYRLFIDEASKLYADALVHDEGLQWLKKRRRSFEWLSTRILRRTRPFLKCES